jgi:hypothetical protein
MNRIAISALVSAVTAARTALMVHSRRDDGHHGGGYAVEQGLHHGQPGVFG